MKTFTDFSGFIVSFHLTIDPGAFTLSFYINNKQQDREHF